MLTKHVLAMLMLALVQSGYFKRVTKDQTLAQLQTLSGTTQTWKACGKIWNIRNASVAVHLEANGLGTLISTSKTDIVFEICTTVRLGPGRSEIRLISDSDTDAPVRVTLDAAEATPGDA